VEDRSALRKLERYRQPHHVAVEALRALEVPDGGVRLEQPLNVHLPRPCQVAFTAARSYCAILAEVSENVELVRAWHRAAMLGDIDQLLSLTDPEFEMNEASALPGAVRVSGPEGLRSYCYGWAKNWSEQDWREEEVIEFPPDLVLFDATLRLRGLRSSIWVERRWAYVLQIRDGRVLRHDGFETKEEALEVIQRSAPSGT